MRVIFEEVEKELFFEVILNSRDVEHFQQFDGIVGDFIWNVNGLREINVFIRKEKESEICHSLKEKKLVVEKDSQKISKEKCMKESRKNKPSLSLTPKREKEKKLLPKRRRSDV